MLDEKLVLDHPVSIEENLHYEFKEVKGEKPVKTIKNTVDEYIVAYLNKQTSGSILWGIRDTNLHVIGVVLNRKERDKLRKDVVSILTNIQPAISPSAFSIELYDIFLSPDDDQPISDRHVIEVAVPEIHTDDLYFTGGNEAFIKTDAGKKKLSGLALQDEVLRRLKQKVKIEGKEVHHKNDETPVLSSAMRRAKLVEPYIEGTQILWVDDNPGNNIYERMTMKSLGISTEVALSTDEAMHMLTFQDFDAIISDMERSGKKDAGLQLLSTLKKNDVGIPLVFYMMGLDENRGTPPGAFGITKYPEDLLHYILDILERRRL